MKKEPMNENNMNEQEIKIEPMMMQVEKKTSSQPQKQSNVKVLKIILPVFFVIFFAVGIAYFADVFDTKYDENLEEAAEEDKIDIMDDTLSEVPKVVEQSIFESLLNRISGSEVTESGVNIKRKLFAYYTLKYVDDELFYVFDSEAVEREKQEILGYWNEYIGWSDVAYIKMIADYNMANYIRDPYSHVRFGKTRDILLLDVEWHTPESYAEHYDSEAKRNLLYSRLYDADYLESIDDEDLRNFERNIVEIILRMSEEEQEAYIASVEGQIEHCELNIELIREGKYFEQKKVNGLSESELRERGMGTLVTFIINDTSDFIGTSEKIDENGYYILEIYPHYPSMDYVDENNEHKSSDSHLIHGIKSKREWDSFVKSTYRPFLDDLLERGLITQEQYAWELTDPLEQAVLVYFGSRSQQ